MISIIISDGDYEDLCKAFSSWEGYEKATLYQFAMAIFRLGIQEEKLDKGNEKVEDILRVGRR